MSKYTVNAGNKFDLLVDRDLAAIINLCLTSKYAASIKAIVLMGSYGRGEGTAFQTERGLRPFNDYDLVVVGKSMNEWKRRKVQKVFHQLERELTKDLEITVDLFLHTENSLKRADASLMNYEMKYGHKVVYGDPRILELMPNYKSVDLSEATRLLLNRGKLLLDISTRLRSVNSFTENELLLYKKYLNKVILAMGDAALMASGINSIYYKNKRDQIEEINSFKNRSWIIDEYQRAVAFKFIGDRELLHEDMEASFHQIKEHFIKFYFEFESIRLSKEISEYNSYYSEMLIPFFKLSLTSKIKNVYLNIRGFGLSELLNPHWLGRHPRERLFTIFPLLFKTQLSVSECRLVSRLEGCTHNVENCLQTFYQLREKYL